MAAFLLRSTSSTERANLTTYATGDRVVIARADSQSNFAVMRRYVFEATTGGVSGASPPVFPTTPGNTVADATVTWTCRDCVSGGAGGWSDANKYIDYLASRLAAGDTIYVSNNHAETSAAGLSVTLAGTIGNPVKVVCADDAAEPPTAVATTATITTTGANSISVSGSAYMYGLTFNSGTGASSSNINLNASTGHRQVCEACKFNLVNTSSSGAVNVTNTSGSDNETIWNNCFAKMANIGQKISVGRGSFDWVGGGLTSGTSAITLLINSSAGASANTKVKVSGVDTSAGAAGINLFQTGPGTYLIRNSKLPTSWSGSITTGTLVPGGRYEMHNCDSADTNYRFWSRDYFGDTTHEPVFIKTGGSEPCSVKVVTTANTTYPAGPHVSIELTPVWNDTVGSSITVTVDILRDSATNLTDAEVALRIQYLGTSGYPLSSFILDAKADILATAADQTTSGATWTTTGMSNPNEQKLSVTFTPQEPGYIQGAVEVYKASTTLYADNVLQVS